MIQCEVILINGKLQLFELIWILQIMENYILSCFCMNKIIRICRWIGSYFAFEHEMANRNAIARWKKVHIKNRYSHARPARLCTCCSFKTICNGNHTPFASEHWPTKGFLKAAKMQLARKPPRVLREHIFIFHAIAQLQWSLNPDLGQLASLRSPIMYCNDYAQRKGKKKLSLIQK